MAFRIIKDDIRKAQKENIGYKNTAKVYNDTRIQVYKPTLVP